MMKLMILCLVCLHLALGSDNLVGGWRDVDLNENGEGSTFNQVVKDIVSLLGNSQNSPYSVVLYKIVSARQQLVNGMNYDITLELGHTNCMKNQNNQNPESCTVNKKQTCTVKAYKPFTGDTSVNHFRCGQLDDVNQRKKRSLMGGLNPASHEEVQESLQFAIDALNSKSNGFYILTALRIKKAEKQIVAGIKHYITLDLHAKSCLGRVKLSDCQTNNNVEEVIECRLEVVDHPWLNPRFELLKHGCESESMPVGKLLFSNHQDEYRSENGNPLSVQNLGKLSTYEAFQIFKAQHNKVYPNKDEENKRMLIFVDNIKKAKFYQDHDLGTAIYGATSLSDLTEEEFREKYLTKEWDLKSMKPMKKAKIPKVKDIPKQFDWRNHSIVTPVKNQGSCGSCWAFCVIGNIEGIWALKYKELYSLSAQELVDCDKIDSGCNGGLPQFAYEEIKRLGGLETEEQYPYHGKEEICSFKKENVKVYINGSVNISTNEAEMAAWMVENGPMAIGINALYMQFYFGGVSHPWSILCPKALNHGVVIVGYGVEKGWFFDTPYWIIKNSWGSSWGEKGYYRIYRGSGACGLNLMVSSSVVN